ncbi:hypothetical protein FHW79_006054 [Azospirillum sp. OGB3]|nr:hypothetical protein [Azospirillum sp. OGB3]
MRGRESTANRPPYFRDHAHQDLPAALALPNPYFRDRDCPTTQRPTRRARQACPHATPVGHHDRAVNANTKSGAITVRNPYFCDRTHRVPPTDANSSGLFLTLRRSEDYVAPSPPLPCRRRRAARTGGDRSRRHLGGADDGDRSSHRPEPNRARLSSDVRTSTPTCHAMIGPDAVALTNPTKLLPAMDWSRWSELTGGRNNARQAVRRLQNCHRTRCVGAQYMKCLEGNLQNLHARG